MAAVVFGDHFAEQALGLLGGRARWGRTCPDSKADSLPSRKGKIAHARQDEAVPSRTAIDTETIANLVWVTTIRRSS
jgi:hypothetical protein